MNILTHALGFAFIASALASAQDTTRPAIQADVTTEAKPWTSLDLHNDPANFQFAVVTDNAGGPRPGVFSEAVGKLNLLQPEFVMSIGDFIEGYEDTKEALDKQWDHFEKEVAGFEMPFFYVPGNHDVGRPLWAETYKERFGVDYYHFVYQDVLFLCLNTNDSPTKGTGIGEAQVAYAEKVLRENQAVKWTLMFQHKPLWNDQDAEGWKQVEALLKGRKATVFAGHTHNYLAQEAEGISYITLATTGGGSLLRGPAYGEFDGVVWVTMTDNGPRVANLLLDGILDRKLRTPESAKELALFRADQAVTVTPMHVDGQSFKEATTTLTISNPSPNPLRIEVLTQVAPGLRVEPSSVSGIIPGNSEHVQELRLTADNKVSLTEVQPLILHWQAFYDHGNNTPSTKLSGQKRVPIEGIYELGFVAQPINVDGKLEEWGLPFAVSQPGQVWNNIEAWRGPEDGRFRFGVAYDEDYVYVAMKAEDDEPYFEGWKYWEDFAMLMVDPRGNSEGDPREAIFSLMAGPDLSEAQLAEYQEGTPPEGVERASVSTENGFTAEFAIPVKVFKEKQGGDWSKLRLNIGFSDFDSNDAREGVSILYWRENWDSRSVDPAAGTFVRVMRPLPE